MKRIAAYLLVLSLLFTTAASATIVENGEVMYCGGTINNLKEGTIGRLDTTSDSNLIFEAGGTKLAIPYAKITEFQYSRQLARHLGVVATVAVVLVKHRQRRHFFRIDFRDEHDTPQVVVLEVSKEMPGTLQAILKARVPAAPSQKPAAKP